MAKKVDIQTKQFSVSLPIELLEEIDAICSINQISRSAWILKAARELLEKERMEKKEDLLRRLTEKN